MMVLTGLKPTITEVPDGTQDTKKGETNLRTPDPTETSSLPTHTYVPCPFIRLWTIWGKGGHVTNEILYTAADTMNVGMLEGSGTGSGKHESLRPGQPHYGRKEVMEGYGDEYSSSAPALFHLYHECSGEK